MIKSFLLGAALAVSTVSMSVAQDAALKICGEKWQAAKAAGTTGGVNWPGFLTQCRAGLATAPAKQPEAKPAMEAPVGGAKAAGDVVFPKTVSPKFSELNPAQARQKTCSEQYQANKSTGGNGGLNWQQKGGGYWSLCNKQLKGA